MKKVFLVILIIVVGGAVALKLTTKKTMAPGVATSPQSDKNMIIASPSFENGKSIPKKFTCEGGGMNPELLISNVPEAAKSLALIMDDPDAPIGTFLHWTVWNIDPRIDSIKEESVPPGATEGTNGAKKLGYIGPCPPSGTHRYFFKLYALDSRLSLPEGSSKEKLEEEISNHLISKSELIGTYKKQGGGA